MSDLTIAGLKDRIVELEAEVAGYKRILTRTLDLTEKLAQRCLDLQEEQDANDESIP